VTCLVGKNESGKTASMEALYRLNPAPSGHRDKFEELYDYPRRRRAADKENLLDATPIEVTFELEEADLNAVEQQFGSGVCKSSQITLCKNYRNTRLWTFEVNEAAAVKHLAAVTGLPGAFARGVATLKALQEKLKAMPERTQSAEQLLINLQDYDLHAKIRKLLAERLPRFVYFNQYSILPGRFSIPYIQQTAEVQLDSGERTALALLRLAGVDSTEFLESNYEARKAALEAAAAQITDEVFEFWSQNDNLRVDFDADFKAAGVDASTTVPRHPHLERPSQDLPQLR
jgi:hypothetical protein